MQKAILALADGAAHWPRASRMSLIPAMWPFPLPCSSAANPARHAVRQTKGILRRNFRCFAVARTECQRRQAFRRCAFPSDRDRHELRLFIKGAFPLSRRIAIDAKRLRFVCTRLPATLYNRWNSLAAFPCARSGCGR
jgi:hypothetical protein